MPLVPSDLVALALLLVGIVFQFFHRRLPPGLGASVFVGAVSIAVTLLAYNHRGTTPWNLPTAGHICSALCLTWALLGWVAVTGHMSAEPLLLVLIIFAWTPPHFWALAIHRKEEYAKADIPMLPVTHGVEFTRLNVLLYTILLVLVTLLPWLTGMSGMIYLAGALVLNAGFLTYAVKLKRSTKRELPMQVFRFSVQYLMWLFLALLVDHYLR